jgi:uncharacterized protein (DUF1778 family)
MQKKIIPISKKETINLNVSSESQELIKRLAQETNSTEEEVIGETLLNNLSQHLTVDEFKELLDKESKTVLDGYYILYQDEKPVARVLPIDYYESA